MVLQFQLVKDGAVQYRPIIGQCFDKAARLFDINETRLEGKNDRLALFVKR